jgi:hypothetical protein
MKKLFNLSLLFSLIILVFLPLFATIDMATNFNDEEFIQTDNKFSFNENNNEVISDVISYFKNELGGEVIKFRL